VPEKKKSYKYLDLLRTAGCYILTAG